MNQLPKDGGSSSSLESEREKMVLPEKQDTTTGNSPTQTPILANDAESMVVPSELSQAEKPSKGVSKNTKKELTPAGMLTTWQTDFFDLQSLGFKVAILASNGVLYASIELPDHKLDTGKGHILLDGQPVLVLAKEE